MKLAACSCELLIQRLHGKMLATADAEAFSSRPSRTDPKQMAGISPEPKAPVLLRWQAAKEGSLPQFSVDAHRHVSLGC